MIPADPPSPAPGAPPASRRALAAFGVLFVMNLLDYTDRNILSAVLPQLTRAPAQGGLGITLDRAGWLSTVFLASYCLIGPVMGWAGDRFRRTILLALGVGTWSLATIACGFADSYLHLAVARSFLGIGEATYGIIAPTILLDLFARERRAQMLSLFYLAMPLGSALGIVAGGAIGEAYGWQTAFFVVGVPGLVAAFAALLLPEPVRGESEKIDLDRLADHERAGASKADYVDLMVNSSYTYTVLGMAFYTFAIGGMVLWVPYYLIHTRGLPQGRATLMLGGVTLAAAALGMSVGGLLADRLARRDVRALFIVPGVAMLAAVPFVAVGLLATSPTVVFVGIFLAEALMFVNTGPCNAIIANVVTPNLRSSAYAIALAGVHIFGDFWSPPLIGWMARTFGQRDAMATPIGRALASIGATPTSFEGGAPENVVAGLLVVVPAMVLSGVVLLGGARHLPREMALMVAKMKAVPARM